MRFSEVRNQLNEKIVEVHTTQDYHKLYLNHDIHSEFEKLGNVFVNHLYQDLINTKIEKDLKIFLDNFYLISNEYAKDCVSQALLKDHIYGMKIKNWTDSALKCFDCFLMKLVNDILDEKFKSTNQLKERDIYQHLISKQGNYYKIGMAFNTIYDQRNMFAHVQIEEIDGVRRPKPISKKNYKKSKKLIIEQFEKALKALLREIP